MISFKSASGSKYLSPRLFFALIVLTILGGELLIMFLLPLVAETGSQFFKIADALILTAIACPLLYLFMYRPLTHHLMERERRTNELKAMVDDRTRELTLANEGLEKEIAAHMLMESELTKSRNEVYSLLEGSRAVLKHAEFREAAFSIFQSCKNLIGATGGYIALLTSDGKENEVLFLDAGGRACTVDPSLPMPIRGLRAQAYSKRIAVFENSFSESEWMEFMPKGHVTIDNVLFAPLVLEGRAVGLMGLANKNGGFTENDARMAMAFGELAAIALNNSRMLELLENSEERFRTVAQTAIDGIITFDTEGKVRFWNNGAERIFARKAEEAIGKRITDFIPSLHMEKGNDGKSAIPMNNGTPIAGKTVEIKGVTSGGKEMPLEFSIAAWQMHGAAFFTGITHDITQRKKTENALKEMNAILEKRVQERTASLTEANTRLESEIAIRRLAEEERTRLAAAIEQAVDSIMITDSSGRIQYINPAFERTTGYGRDEVLGKTPSLLKSGAHDSHFYQDMWKTITGGEVWTSTFTNRKKDGSLFEEQETISPVFNESGKITNYVAVKHDITHEMLLKRAKDYFTSITSHELRTPLTNLQLVKILLNEVREACGGGERLDRIDSVLTESFERLDRVLAMTSLVKDLSVSPSEKRFYNFYLFPDIVASVEKARAQLERQGRGLALKLDLESLPGDAEILGNQELLLKALDNILSNAIKYTPDGKSIHVIGRAEGGFAVMDIRDEGIGIAKEKVPQIFQPYFSIEDPLLHSTGDYAFRGGGLGLGLAISRMIVEHHSGTLTLKSDGQGRGTTVTIRIPFASEKLYAR